MPAVTRLLRRCTVLIVFALASGCGSGTVPAAVNTSVPTFRICLTCHSDAPENRPTGPNLHGLFGRQAGTREGFFYSEALKSSGIVWDEQALDAYLANPGASVPGTFMLAGVPDAAQRAAIISHLRTLESSANSSR